MKLTDEDLIRLAAEKVCGWMVIPHEGRFDGEEWILPANGAAPLPLQNPIRLADWHPLTDWRAAGEIVEKMRADWWELDLHCTVGAGTNARFISFQYQKRKAKAATMESSAPRAITIAALLAVGAITDEQA